MAEVAGVFALSHSPFCYIPPDLWNDIRASRRLRGDVPFDDLAANRAKADRIQRAFAFLRAKLAEAAPDVLVIFGDDQREYLDFDNYPSFAIYVGKEFHGALSPEDIVQYVPGGRADVPRRTVPGHPGLALALLTGLQEHGFDPAFCMDIPETPEVGHAFLRPLESLTDFTLPTVPVMVNCYFAPQVTARRCYQLGRAVRAIIDAYADDLRVAVIGSGGLWHTPGAQDAYLDEAFDRATLRYLEAGDVCGAAAFFDSYQIPEGDRSQPLGEISRTSTGLPAARGPQGGTREFCNWVAAAAVVEGHKAEVIDYIPIYASPLGAGFAYWPGV